MRAFMSEPDSIYRQPYRETRSARAQRVELSLREARAILAETEPETVSTDFFPLKDIQAYPQDRRIDCIANATLDALAEALSAFVAEVW